MKIGEGEGNLSEERFPCPFPFKDVRPYRIPRGGIPALRGIVVSVSNLKRRLLKSVRAEVCSLMPLGRLNVGIAPPLMKTATKNKAPFPERKRRFSYPFRCPSLSAFQRSVLSEATETRNRDSIRSNVFEMGGGYRGEGRTFSRKFFPPACLFPTCS